MIEDRYRALPLETRRPLEKVCSIYAGAGFRCWVVGGAVRDLGLGEAPGDFDLATDAPLEETRKLFHKVFETGADHGTLTLRLMGTNFEVTRLRKDVETDGRHAVVSFAERIEEDLSRRDLRLNAIAFDPLSGEVTDPEGGLEDLAQKRLRFVGDAAQRVLEDHLRALRYLRMLTRLKPLGFGYDPQELAAVQQVFDPEVLSRERVYEELGKMRKVWDPADPFLPEQLARLRPFANCLSGPGHAQLIPKLLRLPDQTLLGFFVALERSQTKPPEDLRLTKREKRLAQALLTHSEVEPQDLPSLRAALGSLPEADRLDWAQAAQVLFGRALLPAAQAVLERHDPLEVKDLELSAKELMELGYQGRELGRIQRDLLAQVWAQPELNRKDRLEGLARRAKSS